MPKAFIQGIRAELKGSSIRVSFQVRINNTQQTATPGSVICTGGIRQAGLSGKQWPSLKFGVAVLFSALMIATSPAAAADDFILQQQREEARRRLLEPNPEVRLAETPVTAAPRLPQNETPCFPIDQLVLTGELAERVQWALAAVAGDNDSPIGRCLGAEGVGVVLKRIQNALIERGYVTTRVLAGPQNLKGGTLTLTLIPGRIRAIRFAPGSGERATWWNTFPMGPGDLLNLRDIEMALENYKRLPTAEADIQIAPSEGKDAQPGDSDLIVTWKQSFPLRLTLTADNSGTQATGKLQGSATLSADNLLGLQDLFYVTLSHDLSSSSNAYGTQGNSVYYGVPFGYWLLSASHNTYTYYQSVAGAYQTYRYSGTSNNNDLRLSRVVWRDANARTTFGVRAWERDNSNYIDDTQIDVQHRRVGGWEINGNHRQFIGQSTVDANLAYRRGTGAFDALPAPEEAFGEGTSRMRIVTGDIQAQVPFELLGQRLRYLGVARMQWADTALVPQDRFAIGSRFTVRGFDGEYLLQARNGWLVRNDLGVTLGASGIEAYLGLDAGQVNGPEVQRLLGRGLAGGVLGLRGAAYGVSYDFFVGKPLAKPEHFPTADTTAGFSLVWSI
jgi:hemolysin activation/secretion protein